MAIVLTGVRARTAKPRSDGKPSKAAFVPKCFNAGITLKPDQFEGMSGFFGSFQKIAVGEDRFARSSRVVRR